MQRSLLAVARWSAVAVAIVLVSGCGAAEEPAAEPEFASDAVTQELDTAISDVGYGGEAKPLTEVTDIEWDEVAVFGEGTEVSEIEDVVGETGIFGDTYVASANLLVFRVEGAVTTMVSLSDVVAGEYGELYGTDAVLRFQDGDSGPVVLGRPQ